MRFRRNLRFRVALGFALLGMGVCLGMTLGLDYATDELEQRLLEETMSTELLDSAAHFELDPDRPLPATATIRRYVLTGSDSDQVPAQLRDLSPGFAEVNIDHKNYAVAVSQRDAQRYFVLYDRTALTRHERGLHLFLLAGIAIMGLLSAVGGRWLAARVIAPVTELARRVAVLPSGERERRLAPDFADDEVGELAGVMDSYMERLAEAMEREQSFTGDVSHELRNSLAVVQGAVDVLRETCGLPDAARRPLERIARSTSLMNEISTALLTLARTDSGALESNIPFAVEDLVRDLVDSHRELLHGKPVTLELRINASLNVNGERATLCILLGNLIRNACFHTHRGHIRITIDAHGVAVEDTGIGLDAAQLDRAFERGYRGAASPGAGIGLSLTQRLCERNGWRLTLDSEKGQGTRAWVGLSSVRV
jgi:signal transduction histidine kinase